MQANIQVMIGQYKFIKKLGKGISGFVVLVEKEQKQYAMKIFSQKQSKLFNHEVSVNLKLNHPFLVKYIEHFENLQFLDAANKNQIINCIVFEYAQNGELFDYIFQKKMNPQLTKKFFIQLLLGINYMHTEGFCHRDIKPENILIDKDNNIKICDLGYATNIQGNGDGLITKSAGTKGYMSPEMLLKLAYNGISTDIFSLGVVLFIMYTGRPPFIEASLTDDWYTLIRTHNYKRFWKVNKMSIPESLSQQEFQSLFLSMCQFESNSRISMSDIFGHPWFHITQEQEDKFKQKLLEQKQLENISQLIPITIQKNLQPIYNFQINKKNEGIHRSFNIDIVKDSDSLKRSISNEGTSSNSSNETQLLTLTKKTKTPITFTDSE